MVKIEDINWMLLNKNLFELPEHQWPLYENQVQLYMEYVAERIDMLSKDSDIRKKARDKIKQNQYEELYRLQSLVKPNEIIQQCHELRNSLGEKRENNNKPYIWLCVNPNSTYSLLEFKALVHKMCMKTWVNSYVYVYEQRGVIYEEKGKGFHLHAIIKRPDDKKPSHCVRELASTFKKCCDVTNYHFFQTKFIDEDEKDRKLKYILGDKESTPENMKDIKQSWDKEWRKDVGLDQFYFLDFNIGQYE